MADLKRDLIDQGMELRETHISQVFLGAESVFKVKKPVALGFVDFSTLELRKHFCEQEVTLNRRLAPSVYRGVVPIAIDASGKHRIRAAGLPVEWAVEMRRLRDGDAADRRLQEGRLGRAELAGLAEQLARFHASARCDETTAHYGSTALIEANVRENFDQTRESAARFLGVSELAAVERWQFGFLREHAARFEARVRDGRIRDGHGDLRLEHCYLDGDGGTEIIDCIEFNERFRYGDVCADVAFLAMDLDWHERHDLSEGFLADYARAADDYDLYGVVDFYQSYRAYVRGKVSSMLEADASTGFRVHERAAAEARKYYALAAACTREPLSRPALYAVGGVIASGKSTLATQLAAAVNAPVIESDRTRKHLAGVDPLTPLSDAAFTRHYDERMTASVYAELLRRAETVLRSGRPVILDASFRDREQRAAVLDLARRCDVRFLFIECVVPPEVSRARLAARARGPSVSDGRIEVFEAFISSFQPVDELPEGKHVVVDTSRPLHETRARIAEWIG
jgi:aminoglycoside phosphotransferase family enzyme/predicted kinase